MKVSPNIGMILSTQMNTNGKDNFTIQMLQGAYKYTTKHNLEISLLITDSENQHQTSFETFCGKHSVTGVIVSGITVTDPYFEEIQKSKLPCVLIDVRMKREGLGCVSADNRKAEQEVTQYLIDRGHSEFLVIAGKKDTTVNEDRLIGIRNGMKENGLPFQEDQIRYCDFNEEAAYRETMNYLQTYGKSRATAFLCLSDLMAFGVFRAIGKCGYRVPDDFSVIGFDGHPLSPYMNPPLTTVVQDFEAMGYQSAKLLRKVMQNPDSSENRYVPYHLLERDSVRRLEK